MSSSDLNLVKDDFVEFWVCPAQASTWWDNVEAGLAIVLDIPTTLKKIREIIWACLLSTNQQIDLVPPVFVPYCACWLDRPLVKGNEDLGTRVLANVTNRSSVFLWATESKPGRPHRIRVEANIKYAVSAYQDACGSTLGFQHGTLL